MPDGLSGMLGGAGAGGQGGGIMPILYFLAGAGFQNVTGAMSKMKETLMGKDQGQPKQGQMPRPGMPPGGVPQTAQGRLPMPPGGMRPGMPPGPPGMSGPPPQPGMAGGQGGNPLEQLAMLALQRRMMTGQ